MGKVPPIFLTEKPWGRKTAVLAQFIFPQKVTCFFCNSVKIGQNFQKEVFFERSIFANIAAYQLNNLN